MTEDIHDNQEMSMEERYAAYLPKDPSASTVADDVLETESDTAPEPAPVAVPEPVEVAEENTAPETPHWAVLMAKIVSGVLSPLLVPTYCIVLSMWLTPLAFLPERSRLLVSFTILFMSAFLPMAFIILMMRLGKVSDFNISNRRERTLPLCVAIVCYVLSAVYLYMLHAPGWLAVTMVSAAVSCGIAIVVSRWWKISAHGTGMGGMVGLLVWLAFNSLAISPMIAWISVAIVLTGLVGTSRLILKHHTPAQVYAGVGLGIAVIYLLLIIWQMIN